MRKHVPRVCVAETPGHFFKHADEQSIVSMAALAQAMERFELDPRSHAQWGIVAAPRYMGRLAAANIVKRFAQGGISSVSPHVLAQYSLHSVAGAISVAMGIHGPNLGVGGGPQALLDGLLAALTMFDAASIPGVWLVLSEWTTEPIPDEQGHVDDALSCRAVALALQRRASQAGEVVLSLRPPELTLFPAGQRNLARPLPRVSALARFLSASDAGPARWSCSCPWGGTIEITRQPAEQKLHRAA